MSIHRQKTHSDIPQGKGLILTVVVALSDVTLASGPTCLYSGSHTKSFHDRHVETDTSLLRNASHYSIDGTRDVSREDKNVCSETSSLQTSSAMSETKENRERNDVVESLPASAAILNAGDILIYDNKIFHYGSANDSNVPRALLMFSFQNCTSWGTIGESINGFTYHLHRSLVGKYTISSFL